MTGCDDSIRFALMLMMIVAEQQYIYRLDPKVSRSLQSVNISNLCIKKAFIVLHIHLCWHVNCVAIMSAPLFHLLLDL